MLLFSIFFAPSNGEMAISFTNPKIVHLTLVFLYIYYCLALFSKAANTITQGELLRDGETIVSSGQIFELGFFSPANSTSRYLGIWYKNVSTQTVIWVANRESSISGKDGVLTIGSNGNLFVLDGNSTSVWSSNASIVSGNSTAILMDTGNLILSSNDSIGDTENALWQSFGNPGDTFLPGMRALMNQTSENQIFTSWKSASDPSIGNYSMGLDPRGSPQIVIWEGSNRHWRSGHWNGLVFLGVPTTRSFYFNGFRFNNEGNETYFTYTISSDQTLRFRLRWDGLVEQMIWNETMEWGVLQSHPAHRCEVYNNCGPFAKCSEMDSPVCNCIEGFEPNNSVEWSRGNWSGGCTRRTPLQCEGNSSSDGFFTVTGVKLPDYADILAAESTEACGEMCLKNCSCNAYAFVVGIQCMMWGVDLVDVEQFADGGKTLYVRVADSELGGKSSITAAQIIPIVLADTIILGLFFWLLWRFRAKIKECSNSLCNKELPKFDASRIGEFSTDFSAQDGLAMDGKQGSRPELPLFNFNFVAAATNDFANKNKLGEGGFGPVYKGILPGGQEIAVKRLSRCSGQGLEEFKNEIILIAKLQHRNLVRLLGCCIEGEEKLLIYEYMPNNSLDTFLFDLAKKAQLDWNKRFSIIEGIARGLLYLHRDSRLRIIHRDMKASNILLDEEMKPKISDFGMARIFGGNQNEANTMRVVGTYGYMSPEYAMEGLFSTKSDVYSFGVLLLEIVSGKKNNSFRSPEYSNLIRYAWHQWNDGKAMELIDPCIADLCSRNEVLRCINVGMLCVQESAIYRPTMSSVVLMLESEGATLPVPRQTTLSSLGSNVDMILMDSSPEVEDTSSTNDVTVTDVVGR